MQRANSVSLGLRSSCPPGHSTIGNLGQLPHDRPGAVDSDRFVIRQFVVPVNFDPSCQNDREPAANLTGPRQDLAGAKRAQPAETTHPLDVSGFEDRKYLIAP